MSGTKEAVLSSQEVHDPCVHAVSTILPWSLSKEILTITEQNIRKGRRESDLAVGPPGSKTTPGGIHEYDVGCNQAGSGSYGDYDSTSMSMRYAMK